MFVKISFLLINNSILNQTYSSSHLLKLHKYSNNIQNGSVDFQFKNTLIHQLHLNMSHHKTDYSTLNQLCRHNAK